MLDIGWPELLVVAIVLIVVVGPKDLPPMLRAFGRTTKKLRGMASEFRGQFDEALREAELDDVKKTFDEARKLNPMQSIRDAVNPLKDTARDIRRILKRP
jgi:sec-independent protein translocase protein TatB